MSKVNWKAEIGGMGGGGGTAQENTTAVFL